MSLKLLNDAYLTIIIDKWYLRNGEWMLHQPDPLLALRHIYGFTWRTPCRACKRPGIAKMRLVPKGGATTNWPVAQPQHQQRQLCLCDHCWIAGCFRAPSPGTGPKTSFAGTHPLKGDIESILRERKNNNYMILIPYGDDSVMRKVIMMKQQSWWRRRMVVTTKP